MTAMKAKKAPTITRVHERPDPAATKYDGPITLTCFGRCRTATGRKRRTPHAVVDLLLNGQPFWKTTCLSCLHTVYTNRETFEVGERLPSTTT